MNIELTKFLDVMDKVGFGLIKYHADNHRRHETDFDHTDNIVNNIEAELIYSGCWYDSLFFRWLFDSPTVPTVPIETLSTNMFVHGEFDSDQEGHYFFIITTDTHAIILNTYGGIRALITNTLLLGEANMLIELIKANNVSAIELLFGVSPSYKTMQMYEFTLEASPPQSITKVYLLNKVDELIDTAHSIEDSNEISKMRAIIEEYY